MKRIILLSWFLMSFLIMRNEVLAGPGLCRANASAPLWSEGKDVPCTEDLSGNLRITPGTTSAGEDVLADIQKVEERFVNIPSGSSTSRVSADQLYNSGPGYVKSISCYSDAVATAGTIILYDSVSAGSGNIIWSFDVQAIAYATPFVVPLEVVYSVGLYLDFTTTADMFCTVAHR